MKNNCLQFWKSRIDRHIKYGQKPTTIWKKLRKQVKRSNLLPTKKVVNYFCFLICLSHYSKNYFLLIASFQLYL